MKTLRRLAIAAFKVAAVAFCLAIVGLAIVELYG